jgi:hypothetical protein
MGDTISTNVIKQAVELSVGVINTAVQNCSTVMTQDQMLSVIGNNNHFSNDSFKSMMNVNISCVQSTEVKNDIKSKIDAKMDQMATSVMGALSLNPGSAEATNIADSALRLGTTITNSFYQLCGTNLKSSQTLEVKGNDNTFNFISYTESAEIVKNCITTATAVNEAVAEVKALTTQKAKAEKKGISLLFMVVIILGILGFMIVGGTAVVTSPAFIAGIIILIGGYIALAYSQKWAPFSKDNDKKDDDDKKEDDDDKNKKKKTDKGVDSYYVEDRDTFSERYH